MTSLATLTGQLGQSRLALLDVLARMPDEAWAPEAWGLREVLAHIAAWDDISARTVMALVDGQPLPAVALDEDEFNRVAAQAYIGLSAPQVVIRLHAARARLVAAVSRAEDVGELPLPWGGHGDLARLVRGLVEHEREHADELRP